MAGHQVGVFVAEGEDAAGFYAHQRGFLGDEGAELTDVLRGVLGCKVQASFRDGGSAAFGRLRNDHFITEIS